MPKLSIETKARWKIDRLLRTQFFPTKSLLSTYLTCHSSAIYTNKGICLPYMLFNCLFLVLHANNALNYSLQVSLSKWLPMVFRTYGERLTCARINRPSCRHMAGTMYIGESVPNYTTPCGDVHIHVQSDGMRAPEKHIIT